MKWRGASAPARWGLTIQTGGHCPQGVGAFLHMHQKLFSRLNVLDDFIINLGWRNQREGVSVGVLAALRALCVHPARRLLMLLVGEPGLLAT